MCWRCLSRASWSGRTPEYLGKKIEAYDVKMAMLVTLVFPFVILVLTGISTVEGFGTSSISNAGPHGLTQILYAFTSRRAITAPRSAD